MERKVLLRRGSLVGVHSRSVTNELALAQVVPPDSSHASGNLSPLPVPFSGVKVAMQPCMHFDVSSPSA